MNNNIIGTFNEITKANDTLNTGNSKLIELLLADLENLRLDVKSGANLDKVTEKFTILQSKLNELKTSYAEKDVTNQENKRFILNQVDHIQNSFFKIRNKRR